VGKRTRLAVARRNGEVQYLIDEPTITFLSVLRGGWPSEARPGGVSVANERARKL
jgi:hypothetical protein